METDQTQETKMTYQMTVKELFYNYDCDSFIFLLFIKGKKP